MILRRQNIAGALSAAAFGVVLLAPSVAPASAAAPYVATRATLADRWSVVNRRPRGQLSPRGGLQSPPPALAELARRELSSGRYRFAASAARPAEAVPWWLQLWQWIGERWRAFWRMVFGNARVGRGQTVVIGDVLIAVAAATVLGAALRLFGSLMMERASRRQSEPMPRVTAAFEWYAAACDRARRGDYAGATQRLFAAALTALSARGLLDDDRSATVGECRRALYRREVELLPAFDAVADEFVAATYAQTPVAAAQWDRARDGYLSLQAAMQA